MGPGMQRVHRSWPAQKIEPTFCSNTRRQTLGRFRSRSVCITLPPLQRCNPFNKSPSARGKRGACPTTISRKIFEDLYCPVPSLAPTKNIHRLEEIFLGKVGPQLRRHVHL